MATKQTPKKTGLAVLHTELCGYVQVERASREQLAEVHGERLTKLEAQVSALYEDVGLHRQELLLHGDEMTALTDRQDREAVLLSDQGIAIRMELDELQGNLLVSARWNLAINIGVTLGACVVTYFLGQWTR